MDDPHLVEAISYIKSSLKCETELIFSFHGFHMVLNEKVTASIDKILFLSKTGYEVSKTNNLRFPIGLVVGNAVDSDVFFPLETEQFKIKRENLGYSEFDEILIWMANDRPRKGFHIFKAVVERVLVEYTDLKVLIIGTGQTINHPNVRSVGRIPNNEVAKYLQLGNYYMFTTLYNEGFGLSMIEAYKCGNVIIASSLGAIPEVLDGLKGTYLIENTEDVDEWINNFKIAKANFIGNENRLDSISASTIWCYNDWEIKFINAIA
jgi:glycosyltransferase involved in cell wall biosynthesis